MAKPKLEVMFNENGKKEWTIDCTQLHSEGIHLWIKNTGTAIAELYSIDLEIPNLFMPVIQELISGTTNKIVGEKTTTVSFINNHIGKYICFVNKPVEIETLLLNIDPDKLNQYENPLKIKYYTWGNWGEVYTGESKIIIKGGK
jgi:hypothetical protein